MATNTPNYNLVKPDLTEFADIEVLNENFDKIDAAIKNSNQIATQQEAVQGTDNNKTMTPLRVSQKLRFNPSNETDLNLYINEGRHLLPAVNTLTNTPSDIGSGNLFLEVLTIPNETLSYQILYQPINGNFWTRGKLTNSSTTFTWTPWKRVDNMDIATEEQARLRNNNNTVMTPLRTAQLLNSKGLLNLRRVTTIEELDSITTNDFFRIGNASFPNLDLLPGTYIVKCYGDGSIAYQDFTLTNTALAGATFRRIFEIGAVGWRPLFPTGTGSLNNLQTTNKDNLVSAINEVRNTSRLNGRNYLQYGDKITRISGSGISNVTYNNNGTVTFSGNTAIAFRFNGEENQNSSLEIMKENIQDGESITTSFDLIVNSGSVADIELYLSPEMTYKTVVFDKPIEIGKPVRGYVTHNFARNSTPLIVHLSKINFASVTVGRFKIEKGTVPTDFTLSNEEINKGISSISQNHYGVATGTNALTLTASPVVTSLTSGLTIQFKNTTANTGNVTINVNGLGSKLLFNNDGSQIGIGKLKANSIYSAVYDGTNFYLIKGGGESSPIKSVQRGEVAFSYAEINKNVTISTINPNKSIVKYTLRGGGQGSGTSSSAFFRASIVDGSTINFQRVNNSNYSCILSYEVIEFEDYVNVSSGTFSMDQEYRNIIAPVVNLNKSFLQFSYTISLNTNFDDSLTGQLQNGIINFRRTVSGATLGVTWFVVEIP